MNSRVVLLAVGLSLIACRMDNPAFEGDDELAERGDDSGDTLESGELDDADASTSAGEGTSATTSMDDVDTSSDEAETSSSTTDADCTPGASCDEALIHCGDYLYGAEEGVCYRRVETPLLGTCNQQGECVGVDPNVCPEQKGEVHFACEVGCVTNSQACAPDALATTVAMADMCVVDGEGPGCHSICTNQNIQHHGCSEGECVALGGEICHPYVCNLDTIECATACELSLECAEGFVCVDFDCVLP